jgi:hypothetical protein
METLNASFPANFLNLPPAPLTSPSRGTTLTDNEVHVKRLIVDLKVDCLSYFEIKNHVERIYGTKISRNYIAGVITEAGQRAHHLNKIYDSKVRGNVKVIEIDETFQGRDACYLSVVDKASNYNLLLVQLQDRNADTIAFVLESIAETLDLLELVITDGYPGYKNMIPEIFDGVAHLFCHVHAYRVFLREIDPINAAAKKAWSRWHDADQALRDLEHELQLKRRCLVRDEERLDKVIVARDAFYMQHGIRKYSKNATWVTERVRFKKQLDNERATVRSRKQTMSNKRKKIAGMRPEVEALKSVYWEKKQKSLQSARLVSGFKRMLDTPWEGFEAERVRFAFVLARSSLDIAHKIVRFMELNPHACATSKQESETICPHGLRTRTRSRASLGDAGPFLTRQNVLADPHNHSLFWTSCVSSTIFPLLIQDHIGMNRRCKELGSFQGIETTWMPCTH